MRKFIAHWLRYKQLHTTNLVIACELQLLWCSFISPCYHWQKRLSSWFEKRGKPMQTLSLRLLKLALPD